MKLVVLAEGDTERQVLKAFFGRWLDAQPGLPAPVRVQIVNLKGSSNYVRDLPTKVALHEKTPGVCGIIGLVDLYGLDLDTPYPKAARDPAQKMNWAKEHLENKAGSAIFRQHFAVHELEAWPISDPSLFPHEIGKTLAAKSSHPEHINSTTPPSKLLKQLFEKHAKRSYRKTTDGAELFRKLDPLKAAAKCPALAALLDDMLKLAQNNRR